MAGNGALRVLGDRYRLDAPLGEGTWGVVYRGFDLAMERAVAVRLLRSDATATADEAERLLGEVRATATVRSAHAATLFDVGETEEGLRFIVTSLVEGESLEARLERDGAMPVDQAVAVALQVCEALRAAHAVGVLHRDVKPANILLSAPGGGDRVTVTDFGLPSRVARGITRSAVGAARTTSPEQIAGGPVDGRADQYALAATLRRALAPSMPAALDVALQRALGETPASRFPDIAAFASALRAATAPAPAVKRDIDPRPPLPPFVLPVTFPVDPRAEPPRELAVPSRDRPPPVTPRPVAPRRARPSIREEEPEEDGVPEWLPPGVWKRVLAYSALALVLGRVFFAPYMTRQITAWLVLGTVVGGAGLGVSVWRSRTRE